MQKDSQNRSLGQATYRIRRSFHLGDRWARLNYALRLLEAGEDFAIALPDESAHEIFEALDLGALRRRVRLEKPQDDVESRALNRRIDCGTAAYECRYFPTHRRPSPVGNRIGYALGANWRAEEKVPPDALALVQSYRETVAGCELVPLGRPHQSSVAELVEVLTTLDTVISVDCGVAHVARSVGTPLHLLEYRLSVERGFPQGACEYVRIRWDSEVKARL